MGEITQYTLSWIFNPPCNGLFSYTYFFFLVVTKYEWFCKHRLSCTGVQRLESRTLITWGAFRPTYHSTERYEGLWYEPRLLHSNPRYLPSRKGEGRPLRRLYPLLNLSTSLSCLNPHIYIFLQYFTYFSSIFSSSLSGVGLSNCQLYDYQESVYLSTS